MKRKVTMRKKKFSKQFTKENCGKLTMIKIITRAATQRTSNSTRTATQQQQPKRKTEKLQDKQKLPGSKMTRYITIPIAMTTIVIATRPGDDKHGRENKWLWQGDGTEKTSKQAKQPEILFSNQVKTETNVRNKIKKCKRTVT